MSLLTKGFVAIIFFSTLVALIALLPSVNDYPLPAIFNTSLTLIFGYYFAWTGLFTCLNILFWSATFSIGLDLVIWIWNTVRGIIGWVARMIG